MLRHRARLTPQRTRRAATAVEFAFMAPIFFIMFLAIVEFGRAFMVTALLTDAARRGCRSGIVEGTSSAQITSTAVTYLQASGISGETVQVIINDGNGNLVEAQNVPAYTEITVLVQVPMSSVTWLPVAGMQIFYPTVGKIAVGPTGNLTGQATMRRE